jgi:hypothetical protein
LRPRRRPPSLPTCAPDTSLMHVSTQPYARALDTTDFGERSDSIHVGPLFRLHSMKFSHSVTCLNMKWVHTLKSAPNSATSSSSSRAPPSSTSPSSAASSSSGHGMGNTLSRKSIHSRQRSAPTAGVSKPRYCRWIIYPCLTLRRYQPSLHNPHLQSSRRAPVGHLPLPSESPPRNGPNLPRSGPR